jgi:hypothetical protein
MVEIKLQNPRSKHRRSAKVRTSNFASLVFEYFLAAVAPKRRYGAPRRRMPDVGIWIFKGVFRF